MLDHSSYMLNTPLGSMLRRVDDTKSWIGCERKQSLREPKHPASAVQASRRNGERGPTEAAAPEALSRFPSDASFLRSEGKATGVDLGLPFDREEGEAVVVVAVVRCMALFEFPVPLPAASSV